MNATHHRPSAKPERLAPSVDPAWVRDFVVEQRLRGVGARQIGDALVTVESHVRESGESATEAFGDPAEYARALPAGTEWTLNGRTVLELLLGLVGMLLVTRAFSEWLAGEAVRVTTGDLATAALLAVFVGALLLRATPVLRLVVERPVLAWGLALVPLVAFVAVRLLLRTELFTLPVALVAVVGALALATSSAMAWASTGEEEITGPGEPVRRSRTSRRVGVLLYPVLTLGLMALSWVPTLFG
ncbi:hypothetical protein [Serinicoccus kebangsaanensis]|uniref:hypothetical protein n=1 Tax=Serinicoccus kebangsaanensis TaxID=2602069 RepID=UPI00124C57C2|nr:hypothetical protein [Serinicoccus kebangsaanensis]